MKTVFLVVKKHTNKEGKKREGEGVGVWERNGRKDDRQGLRISHISKFFPFWAATHFPHCFLRAKNCCNVLRVFGSKYLDIKAEREVWLYWRRCLPSLAGITNHCLLVVIGVNTIYKLKSRMCSNLVHGGRGRKHYTSTMLYSKPNLDPKLKCKEKKRLRKKFPPKVSDYKLWVEQALKANLPQNERKILADLARGILKIVRGCTILLAS